MEKLLTATLENLSTGILQNIKKKIDTLFNFLDCYLVKFTAENRVRHQKDFDQINKFGKKINCSAFVIYVLNESQEKSRIGIIASKKVGNAVARNYAKRVFRSIFREISPSFPRNISILVYVRNVFNKYDYSQIKSLFEKGLEKL